MDIHTKAPLAFATVVLANTQHGTVADESGAFELHNICEEEVNLEVQFVGYKTVVHHHDFHHPSPTIYLAPIEHELQSIVVENKRTNQVQSLALQQKKLDETSLISSSLGEVVRSISGVSLLKTGANVSKPIIHGLHSNRVLVINNGVRHGYQVWGQEHAPEIDPSNVEQIQVVKGAATVKYGPDALGGVILYNAKEAKLDVPINGSLGTSFHTNGSALVSKLSLSKGYDRFAWNIGGFGTYQGDLQAPDYNLSNTGKREYAGSFNTLWHQPRFDLKLFGSYFNQEIGILRGSIVGSASDLQNAIERSTPSPTSPFTYDIQNPKQTTEHMLLKSELDYYWGESVFNMQFAAQVNEREEYDVRRGDLNTRPVISLLMHTHTVDLEWAQPSRNGWSGTTGVQLFSQKSANQPDLNPANFVPDYDIFNIGAFTIQSYTFANDATLEIGARFDKQKLYAADTIYSTTIYSNEIDYTSTTFTIGFKKQLTPEISILSNVGYAWRPPNVAELYSFGYHHSVLQYGLLRYELEPALTTANILDETDKAVPAEKGLKWVTGVEVTKPKTKAEFIFYANQIDNYIFLKPYDIITGIRSALPAYIYEQSDALLLGSDWDIHYQHTPAVSSELKVSYVYALERAANQAFVEIPPLNVQYSIKKTGPWSYGLNLSYTARQWHEPTVIEPSNFDEDDFELDEGVIFDFMEAPDGFFLLGGNVSYEKSFWKASLTVDNMLNTSYRLYTDRLRYFADDPGRNIAMTVLFKF